MKRNYLSTLNFISFYPDNPKCKINIVTIIDLKNYKLG